MERGRTCRSEVTSVGEEQVRAFVPAPLPPDPPIVFDAPLQRAPEAVALALGRLDGVSALLPDTEVFLYAYIRMEAVLSSQIEGTQASLSDLLLFELDEAPGVPFDDVVEVLTTSRHWSTAWLAFMTVSHCRTYLSARSTPCCSLADEVATWTRASFDARRTGSAAAVRAMPPSC